MLKNWAARHWAARHWAARHWAARHWAEIFPGRGRFGTLLSHPALLLATGNRGLSLAGDPDGGRNQAGPRPDEGPQMTGLRSRK